jgi:hypothetical protein
MLDAGPGLLMLYRTDFRPLKPPFAGLDGATSVKLESLTAFVPSLHRKKTLHLFVPRGFLSSF